MFTLRSFYRYSMSLLMWTGLTMIICYASGADLVLFGFGGVLLALLGYSQLPTAKEDIKVWNFNEADSFTMAMIPDWVYWVVLVVSVAAMFIYAAILGTPAHVDAIVPFDSTVPSWMEVTTYSGELVNRYNVL